LSGGRLAAGGDRGKRISGRMKRNTVPRKRRRGDPWKRVKRRNKERHNSTFSPGEGEERHGEGIEPGVTVLVLRRVKCDVNQIEHYTRKWGGRSYHPGL